MSYIQNTSADLERMLESVGVPAAEDLFEDIPRRLRMEGSLDLPAALSEMDLLRHMSDLAARNRSTADLISFLGAGAYDHYTPALVDALQSRGEFLTAYTPYQAEASQGTLQHIYEFQTMICGLTGMEVANASHYDAATALADAAGMALAQTGRKSLVVSALVHPHYRAVLRTMYQHRNVRILEVAHTQGTTPAATVEEACREAACVIVQNPNFFGVLEDLPGVAEAAHRHGALAVCAVNPVALGLLRSPGECGFDIACGDAQPLGIPLSFGGPWAGFLSAKKGNLRSIPGRVVGETTDADGKRGFVLTLQTREQHIRREKATSNICTNQALMALRATLHMAALGPRGLAEAAALSCRRAHELASRIPGRRVYLAPFFHEFVAEFSKPAGAINAALLERGFLGGFDLSRVYPDHRNMMLLCCTERRTPEDIEAFARALREIVG